MPRLASRSRRICRLLGRHPACPTDYAWTLHGLEGEAREEAKKGCHQRGADRLLAVCFANGGIYIKLGQHIGMLVRVCCLCAAGMGSGESRGEVTVEKGAREKGPLCVPSAAGPCLPSAQPGRPTRKLAPTQKGARPPTCYPANPFLG